MNQWATDTPTAHFPDDVLVKIFLKLPVRSLFILRSVSKHWLNLIQNPSFINLHINRPINNNDQYYHALLIVRSIEHEWEHKFRSILLTLLSDDETLAYKYDVALELVSPSMALRGLDSWGSNFEEDKFHLLGPCNGLFCITDSVDVVLINPATRQCKKVPCSTLSPPRNKDWYHHMDVNGYFNCVSFGFDSVCNDYKVVKFNLQDELDNYSVDDDDDDDDDGPNDHQFKVEIFSLSTNCWREVDCVLPTSEMYEICSRSLFFNGAFHWLGGDDDDDIRWILVFDLNKEAFNMFELPNNFSKDNVVSIYLSVLNESLAAVVHTDIYYSESSVKFEIWVMAKYGLKNSWRKLYNISDDVRIERPLSFSKKDEFLVENRYGGLMSFNLNTKEIKEFEVFGVPGSMHAFSYRESLVSLK